MSCIAKRQSDITLGTHEASPGWGIVVDGKQRSACNPHLSLCLTEVRSAYSAHLSLYFTERGRRLHAPIAPARSVRVVAAYLDYTALRLVDPQHVSVAHPPRDSGPQEPFLGPKKYLIL